MSLWFSAEWLRRRTPVVCRAYKTILIRKIFLHKLLPILKGFIKARSLKKLRKTVINNVSKIKMLMRWSAEVTLINVFVSRLKCSQLIERQVQNGSLIIL